MISIALIFALGAAAQTPAVYGKETTIPYASNGGLRDWQRAEGSSVIYVRDRNERWYQVVLTGPCGTNGAIDTLTYTTDSTGTFDKFSHVSTARFPDQVCGVTSIRASAPPPSRPGAAK